MFEVFLSAFQWRKASRCKKMLQQLQSLLKLLTKEKLSVSRILRHDAANFIRANDQTRALILTKELFIVQNSISVYDLLLQFTDLILLKFDYIRKQKFGGELLDDNINEAVSSLVFASTRCGKDLLLQEILLSIREIIRKRYGQLYISTALHLGHGNLVNVEIKEKLSSVNISQDVIVTLLEKLAKQYGLDVEEDKKSEEETEDVKNEEERRKILLPKHIHPKLPDYDQIVDKLIRAKNEEEERRRRLLPKHVHPKLPDCDQIVSKFKSLRTQHCMHLYLENY